MSLCPLSLSHTHAHALSLTHLSLCTHRASQVLSLSYTHTLTLFRSAHTELLQVCVYLSVPLSFTTPQSSFLRTLRFGAFLSVILSYSALRTPNSHKFASPPSLSCFLLSFRLSFSHTFSRSLSQPHIIVSLCVSRNLRV